ncbi:hypothetical protein MFU01_53450 [Myxococcus fulvus]|uniref:Uncharacterized protein n=1 Tax=Myxococcus fulvus TaxID=33 RepID=A0A511TAY3_MYXFU|nr:hypothetical protein MFU01_53450 [Myxococcus fulvus]
MPLDVHGDELNVCWRQLREERGDPDVDDRDAQPRLREVQGLSWGLDRNSQAPLDLDRGALPEPVRLTHLAALAINRRIQVPPSGDLDIIVQLEEAPGHGREPTGLPAA